MTATIDPMDKLQSHFEDQIQELKAEILDLWGFVRAADEVAEDGPMEGDAWFPSTKRVQMMERYEQRRNALNKWVGKS